MININYGRNQELLDRCRRLRDYAVFVSRVRENEKQGMSLADAVDQAVDTCVEERILIKQIYRLLVCFFRRLRRFCKKILWKIKC